MTRAFAFAATILVMAAMPTSAQDNVGPIVEAALQSCLEGVHQLQEDPEATERPTGRECIGTGSNTCQLKPGGDSTMGMVACNDAEDQFWNDLGKYYYGTLKETLEANASDALEVAQDAWETWREAKCNLTLAIYSEGSIRQVIYTYCRLETAADWTIHLGDLLAEFQPR